jgi:hypothetical protein
VINEALDQNAHSMGSAVDDWSASVPVAEGEQIAATVNSYSHQGKRFRTERLAVRQQWRSGPAWELSGPNIRIDGSPGQLLLTAYLTKEEADAQYPETMKALRTVLADMCDEVLLQAEAAIRQLQEAAR